MPANECPKCQGEMIPGRIPVPLKYLFGFKSDDQKHFSFETNIERAYACSRCGYIELFVDPAALAAKRA